MVEAIESRYFSGDVIDIECILRFEQHPYFMIH